MTFAKVEELEGARGSMGVNIKVSFGNELRRAIFNGSGDSGGFYYTLCGIVAQLFALDPSSKLNLKYQDEDGDLITMSTDNEVQEAMQEVIRANKTLRLFVEVVSLSTRNVGMDHTSTTLSSALPSPPHQSPSSGHQHQHPELFINPEPTLTQQANALPIASLQVASSSPSPFASLSSSIPATMQDTPPPPQVGNAQTTTTTTTTSTTITTPIAEDGDEDKDMGEDEEGEEKAPQEHGRFGRRGVRGGSERGGWREKHGREKRGRDKSGKEMHGDAQVDKLPQHPGGELAGEVGPEGRRGGRGERCGGGRGGRDGGARREMKEGKQEAKQEAKERKRDNKETKQESKERKNGMKETLREMKSRAVTREDKLAVKEFKARMKAEFHEDRLNAKHIGDVTIPDDSVLPADTQVTKTWKMKNVGTAAWPPGSQLVYVGRKALVMNGAEGTVVMAGPVLPEEEVNVSVTFITPREPGHYKGIYRMVAPDGNKFGKKVWTSFAVAPAGVVFA